MGFITIKEYENALQTISDYKNQLVERDKIRVINQKGTVLLIEILNDYGNSRLLNGLKNSHPFWLGIGLGVIQFEELTIEYFLARLSEMSVNKHPINHFRNIGKETLYPFLDSLKNKGYNLNTIKY